jgi:hypothetical protein
MGSETEEAHMKVYSTSEVCALLGLKEHNLNQGIRCGKVTAPELFRGRRLWQRSHIISAAIKLGLHPPVELLARRKDGRPEGIETRGRS